MDLSKVAIDSGAATASSAAPAGGKALGRMKSPFTVLFLSAVCGMIVYAYNDVLSGKPRNSGASVSVEDNEALRQRRLAMNDPEWEKRVALVTQTTWPKCREERWDGVTCKNFIDDIILSDFTGIDKLTRTIIMDKRRKMDEWYNAVVIYMGDDDMVLGRDGDGLIYYDFEWEGSGILATPEQEQEIPPVIGTETPAGHPDATGPESDPLSEFYNPIIIEYKPIIVRGCTMAGARAGTDTNPIAGGVVINLNIFNTPEGQAALDDALAAADAASVEAAGARTLPPFDCSGMTGYSCCLMIKATVKDADVYNKSIQCHLNFVETTNKAKHFLNHRGKKVHIFTNHNFIVSRIPKVVGSWPKGAEDLEGWVEDGGTDGY